MRRGLFLFFVLFSLLLAAQPVGAYSNPGKPAGFVNDYAELLTVDQKTTLENKLTQFIASSSNEVAVVTIKSLDGDTIENYAVKLFADWQIGKSKQDNGVLLLVSLADRKMRIEVGYGLEGALPDATTNQIITKTLRPAFQAGNYYDGINAAVDQIISATRGEYAATGAAVPEFVKNWNFESVIWIIIGIFYLLSALRSWLAKSKSWWQGGVLGGVIGLILSVIFFQSLVFVLTPVLLICGFVFDYLVSRILPAPKPGRLGRGIWFLGGPGGFGGGGSGGGGFGGFGGGGSGGGGSSGGW